ncbi:hypothetical protein C7H19_25105 [Aphanothece hegewaldii CCALA 016]|uniref:Nucleotidyltransferase n=1 Tax=Aphanothece hegewaldii CCALA 016 TaxID=2107694 RepID=A0A2T1LQB1_9CHRO|nr:hypothetical protein [Aphanothece hegewaldii]PSF26709.1 hypothetical protein C7H19_25105 [Aphanothece hegewaldii CCALA 016]
MTSLTPENLRSLLVQLQESESEIILVGGQAINLWASFYQAKIPQLENFFPFASEDLDFYGGRLDALACHQILGGQIYLAQGFDPSPNAGILTVDYQQRKLRIDFLATVYGLNEVEIVSTAIPFEGKESLQGITLKVLHPILCLEGKLKCLQSLPQQGRQDLKHVKMSILCLHQFLLDLAQQQALRPFLKLTERLMTNALNEIGLSVWYHHSIYLEKAIPLNCELLIAEPKGQQFYSVRWPQLKKQLESKRSRYQTLMERVQPD